MQAIDKHRDTVVNILKSQNFDTLPKQFYQGFMILLQINDFKMMNSKYVAQRIIAIYESCKGHYDKYLGQKKYSGVHTQLKEYVQNIFNKFHEQVGIRKQPHRNNFQGGNPQQHRTQIRMNMLNMFLNVPSLQSIQQIQFFQKKMYQICKKSMPQILNNLSMGNMPRMPRYNTGNIVGNMNYDRNHEHQSPSQGNYFQKNNYMMHKKPNDIVFNSYANLYSRQDQSNEQLREQSRQRYSQEHIKSPNKVGQKGFFSQKDISYESQNQLIRNKPIGGFTFYQGRSPKQSPGTPKIPTFLNVQPKHNLDNYSESFHYQPRKLVKRDIERQNNCIGISKNEQIFKCSCQQQNNTICEYCQITKIDHFNQVKQVLKYFKFQNNEQQISINIDKRYLQKIQQDSDSYDIQIRSIKKSQHPPHINFPQCFSIKINNQQISDFHTNTIKKQSKNQPTPSFLLTKQMQIDKIQKLSELNLKIQCKNKQTKQQILSDKNIEQYLIVVVFVHKLSVQKLYEKIKKNVKITRISQLVKKQLQNQAYSSPQDKVIIKPTDQLTKQIVDQPVRGSLCLHLQCFDLKTFLQYQKFSQFRSWKCPICKKSVSQFVLDQQLQQFLSDAKMMITQPIGIMVNKNGGHRFIHTKEKKKKSIYNYDEKQKPQENLDQAKQKDQ